MISEKARSFIVDAVKDGLKDIKDTLMSLFGGLNHLPEAAKEVAVNNSLSNMGAAAKMYTTGAGYMPNFDLPNIDIVK